MPLHHSNAVPELLGSETSAALECGEDKLGGHVDKKQGSNEGEGLVSVEDEELDCDESVEQVSSEVLGSAGSAVRRGCPWCREPNILLP